MKQFLLFLWQLPQNLLGMAVVICSNAVLCRKTIDNRLYTFYATTMNFGVSLGSFIIVNEKALNKTVKHETGHQMQSLLLGPLYLLIIGLPSLLGNILHRKVNFDYYKQPWERWADILGGVSR